MRKEKIRNSVLGLILLGLLFYEIFVAKGENYYLVSMAILLIGLFGFFAHYEKQRPGVMMLTMIASLCALAIVGRIAFFFLPQVKPIAAIVILAGIGFGGEVGFVTGALSAFVSNFYFGQGSWTPFQMGALGLVGFFAGVIFYGRESKRWLAALYGFIAVVIIYGGIVDLNTVFFTSQKLSLSVVLFVYLSGLPFNLLFGTATAGFLFLLYKPVLSRINRMVKKYRLFDKNDV